MEQTRINALFALGGEHADEADAEVTEAIKKKRGNMKEIAITLGMDRVTLYRLFNKKRGYKRLVKLARAGEL